MEIILLLIILLIVAPGLMGLLIVPLILFIGFLLVGQVLFHSVSTLVTAPRSLLWIALNKRIRQNHALEHATVNVIEEKLGKSHLAGYAVKDGFRIRGTSDVSPELIMQAARIGHARMKSGENDLAIHTRCGSSLLITNLLFSLLVVAMFVGMRFFNIYLLIAALIAINALGKPLGILTQKYITTSSDVSTIVITHLDVKDFPIHPLLQVAYREFYVHTDRCQPAKVFTPAAETTGKHLMPIPPQ